MRELTALEMAKIDALCHRGEEHIKVELLKMINELTTPLHDDDVITVELGMSIGVTKRELLPPEWNLLEVDVRIANEPNRDVKDADNQR